MANTADRLYKKVLRGIGDHPNWWFWSIVGVVAIFILSHELNQRFEVDFWQHASLVKELSQRPWHPMHPDMHVQAPHEFTNPYLLGAGLLCRLTKWNSVIILSILAFVNWWFFAAGLRSLCDRLFKVKAVAPLALLLTLCFWGPLAWNFSGFWHLKMIGDSAAFPSTFAGAATFWLWVLCLEYLRKKRFVIIPIIAIAIGVIAVTHPHTAVTAVLGMAAFWYGLAPKGERIRSGVLFGTCVIVGAALAFLWPYYSLWELMGQAGAEHESGNQWMYVNVIAAIGPVLLGVPIVLWRFKENRRDPLAFLFVVLCLVYLLGEISGKYALGRNISFIAIVVHLAIAAWLVKGLLPVPAGQQGGKGVGKLRSASRPVMMSLLAIWVVAFFVVGCIRYVPGRFNVYPTYPFLSQHVGQDDVVMTDMQTARIVPVIAGKVVATARGQSFVPDLPSRREDVLKFFDPSTTTAERRGLITKYDVSFVLLNKLLFVRPSEVVDDVERLGRVVADNNNFILLDVRSDSKSTRDDVPSKGANRG